MPLFKDIPLFKKVLIANRGEIAVRINRACKELGLSTVAVYSEADRESMHVRLADESVCIGPARARESYLSIPAVLSAAEITDSAAIHPGYGFLAENPQFAEACEKSKIAFIGPTPENIRLGGNKTKAKLIMRKHGIPVIPGTEGTPLDRDTVARAAKRLGYPVIIKASAGGGGKGMRIVKDESYIEEAFAAAKSESLAAFGSDELYLERYMPDIKHIEVQIAVDSTGTAIHMGQRDCSIQRRHQKLIEESPCASISAKVSEKLAKHAVRAVESMRYRNIGTVEFIVDASENVYFMEINTRVQVEHPVTEMVTGIDIIKEQIRLASGLPLSVKQKNVHITGHAIECRINAEDPETFKPCPGTITFLYLPGGPGIRVDTGVYAGYTIPPHYDSLIAKVISYGLTRREAIDRMKRGLAEFRIDGIRTTIPFHRRVLASEEFMSGSLDTGFLDRINDR